MILACGSNGKYQLGNGSDEDSSEFIPCKFLIDGQITQSVQRPLKILHGGNHTMVLFENGQLFSCGDNTFGQCGHDSPQLITVFTQVPGKWSNASCGWEFSILVNDKSELFVCGLGSKGELGLGDTTQCKLTKIPIDLQVDDIQSTVQYTLLRSGDNFYAWGNGKKGQFIEKAIFQTPTKVDLPRSKDIKSYALTKDSVVLNYGSSIKSLGRLEIEVQGQIQSIKTMWSSIHYQIDGKLSSQGNNSHGQLSDNHLTNFESFETGSEHGILQKDQLYSWGWGEHGNCGTSSEPNHDQIVFKQLNPIYDQPVSLISCGCATTFIVQ